MRSHVVCMGLAVSSALLVDGHAAATDFVSPKMPHKYSHSHYRGDGRLSLPGPILAKQVTRGPTCGFVFFPSFPNYAKASCRDYDGVLIVYDPRSPTGVGLYPFRAYHHLR